eukprot:TRINITY_DN7345_c0_g1_i1.p1 TRINITY_DN7345_c0_g1~~TRINITY_DN7345_c0_g1_i1.p1  ORF type:complete len:444 (+),score=75.21 TRINITY_DN7345_c0_g1_i1:895-2226(+)
MLWVAASLVVLAVVVGVVARGKDKQDAKVLGLMMAGTLCVVYMLDIEDFKGRLMDAHTLLEGNTAVANDTDAPVVSSAAPAVRISKAAVNATGCPSMKCAEGMDVMCAVRGDNIDLWVPPSDTLQKLAVNNTIFLSTYRTSTPGPLSDMWFNMLHHFAKVVPGGTALLGMSHCPVPSFDTVMGTDYYITKTEPKKGGELPPDTTYCHPLPHPCDCPEKLMHAKCKFAMILAVLKKGFAVFWMDSDTVLLNNPLRVAMPEKVDMLGCYEQAYHLNLGMLRIKSSAAAIAAFEVALESLHNEKGMEEATKRSKHGFGGPWLYEQALVAQVFHLNGAPTKYPMMPLSRPIHNAPHGHTYLAKADAWNPIEYPCRAQNKRYFPAWKQDAAAGKVTGIHASGGCGSHIWLKKGFLIELQAWYNKTETSDYTEFSRMARERQKKSKKRR